MGKSVGTYRNSLFFNERWWNLEETMIFPRKYMGFSGLDVSLKPIHCPSNIMASSSWNRNTPKVKLKLNRDCKIQCSWEMSSFTKWGKQYKLILNDYLGKSHPLWIWLRKSPSVQHYFLEPWTCPTLVSKSDDPPYWEIGWQPWVRSPRVPMINLASSIKSGAPVPLQCAIKKKKHMEGTIKGHS